MAEAAGLHVAVLSIGEAGATPDDALVVDRLRAAGHSIVARASVDNFVPVVRRQLAAWVGDANVDVVVAVGGGDDNVASSALAPLITQQLPGFADVFRMLVFQALGSAAVLVNAEAARCTAKVVFLLPAMADGVRLALDKLIVPQLDTRTEPYNLARLMPRRPTPPPTNDKPTPGNPAATDPPPTTTAPPRTASARTTPPPFRRTPPAGVTSSDKPAEPANPAVKPAEVANASTDKPKPDDSGKLVVDLESIGGVVEPEESGKLRAGRPEPAAPLPIGKSKKSIDPDRTERMFLIRARESQPRMGMFGAPRTQIHPVAKALALLALLALTATGAIVVWSRIGLGTRRVSASNPAPNDPLPPAPAPAQQPQPAVVPPSIDPPRGSAASAEIDVDPTPTPTPTPHSHIAATPPARPTPPPPTPPSVRPAVQPVASSGDGCDEVACVLDQYARPCCEAYRPKTPSERPSAPDQLDRLSIREAVDTMKPVVIACGERFKVKGQVRIALVVAPDGHVTSSTVASSPDEGLGACVADALGRVQFKQTTGGAHFTYPYQF